MNQKRLTMMIGFRGYEIPQHEVYVLIMGKDIDLTMFDNELENLDCNELGE